MEKLIDLSSYKNSRNIRNVFEEASSIFQENVKFISQEILPNYVKFQDFPYDEQIYNKLKKNKHISIADCIYGLLLGFWFRSNHSIINLLDSSRRNIIDLNVNVSAILLRSGFEYYSLLYYVISKVVFYFKNKDWDNLIKILLRSSFSLGNLTKDKFYNSPSEIFFQDLIKLNFKRDFEPIQAGVSLDNLNKKFDWTHPDAPEIDKIIKEEFSKDQYSYLSEITHPVGVQSKLPDEKLIKTFYRDKNIEDLEDFFDKILMDFNDKSFNDIDYKLYEYIFNYSKILNCSNYLAVVNFRTCVLIKEMNDYILKNQDLINNFFKKKIGKEILFKIKN